MSEKIEVAWGVGLEHTCLNCKFFDQFKIPNDDADGHCRLHAPTVLIDPVPALPQTRIRTAWPTVTVDDWCGDGERIDQAHNEEG